MKTKVYRDEKYMGSFDLNQKRKPNGQFDEKFRKHTFTDTLATIARRSLIGTALASIAFVGLTYQTYVPLIDASIEVENVAPAVDDRTEIEKRFDDAAAAKTLLTAALEAQRAWNEEMKEINRKNAEIADGFSAATLKAQIHYEQTLARIGEI